LKLKLPGQTKTREQKSSPAFKLDRVSRDHGSTNALLPKLDAAILDKAFRGQLVRQDPNDEPAAELLKRVKADLGEQRGSGGKRTPRAKTTKDKNMPLAKPP
jgi:type I restriction enzyme, S subunit